MPQPKKQCQRKQPGVHDCENAKKAERQTNLLKKKNPTDKKSQRERMTPPKERWQEKPDCGQGHKTLILQEPQSYSQKEKTCGLTACVTCVWAGVDSVWEQEKLEARKMPENRAESHTSGVSMKAQSDGIAVGHVFGYALFVR